MRTTLLSLGWIAACAAIVGLLLGIDLDLNFFSWVGTWHLQAVACMAGVLTLIVVICLLALATKSPPVAIAGALSCLLLVGVGIYGAQPEPLGNPGQWLTREERKPRMVSMGEIGHYLHSIVYLDVYVYDQRATTKPINVMIRNSIGWSWSESSERSLIAVATGGVSLLVAMAWCLLTCAGRGCRHKLRALLRESVGQSYENDSYAGQMNGAP